MPAEKGRRGRKRKTAEVEPASSLGSQPGERYVPRFSKRHRAGSSQSGGAAAQSAQQRNLASLSQPSRRVGGEVACEVALSPAELEGAGESPRRSREVAVRPRLASASQQLVCPVSLEPLAEGDVCTQPASDSAGTIGQPPRHLRHSKSATGSDDRPNDRLPSTFPTEVKSGHSSLTEKEEGLCLSDSDFSTSGGGQPCGSTITSPIATAASAPLVADSSFVPGLALSQSLPALPVGTQSQPHHLSPTAHTQSGGVAGIDTCSPWNGDADVLQAIQDHSECPPLHDEVTEECFLGGCDENPNDMDRLTLDGGDCVPVVSTSLNSLGGMDGCGTMEKLNLSRKDESEDEEKVEKEEEEEEEEEDKNLQLLDLLRDDLVKDGNCSELNKPSPGRPCDDTLAQPLSCDSDNLQSSVGSTPGVLLKGVVKAKLCDESKRAIGEKATENGEWDETGSDTSQRHLNPASLPPGFPCKHRADMPDHSLRSQPSITSASQYSRPSPPTLSLHSSFDEAKLDHPQPTSLYTDDSETGEMKTLCLDHGSKTVTSVGSKIQQIVTPCLSLGQLSGINSAERDSHSPNKEWGERGEGEGEGEEFVALQEVMNLSAADLVESQFAGEAMVPSCSPAGKQAYRERQQGGQPTRTPMAVSIPSVNSTHRGEVRRVTSAIPDESGTLCGLIKELAAMNSFILRCRRELGQARRQRGEWLRSQTLPGMSQGHGSSHTHNHKSLH